MSEKETTKKKRTKKTSAASAKRPVHKKATAKKAASVKDRADPPAKPPAPPPISTSSVKPPPPPQKGPRVSVPPPIPPRTTRPPQVPQQQEGPRDPAAPAEAAPSAVSPAQSTGDATRGERPPRPRLAPPPPPDILEEPTLPLASPPQPIEIPISIEETPADAAPAQAAAPADTREAKRREPAPRRIPQQPLNIQAPPASTRARPDPSVIRERADRILSARGQQPSAGPRGDARARAAAIIAACEAELPTTTDKLRSARLHYEIGNTYEVYLREDAKAIHHYQKSLETAPQYIPSLRGARRLLLRQKSYPSVLKLMDAEIRLEGSPKQKAMLHYQKGRLLEDKLHQQTKARQCYLQALEMAPGTPELIDAVRQVELKAKNWPALSLLIEQAASAVQTDRAFRASLVAERAGILDARLGAPAEAAETYRSALAIHPAAYGVVPPLKRLLYRQSRWQELVELLENEAKESADEAVQTSNLLQIARIYAERLGARESAVEALERANQLSPTDIYVLEELTRQLASTDAPLRLIDGLKRLAEQVASVPEKVGILHRIGQIYDRQLQDPAAAAEWHERALSLAPAYVPSLRALGDLYRRLERWEALVRMYVAEAAATENTQRRADAHVRVAEIYEHHLGNPAEAAVHHHEALSLAPGLESSFKALVRIYTQARQPMALIRLYEAAAELARTEDLAIAYLFRIGGLYEDALDDSDSAVEVYRRILRIDPKHLGAIHAVQRAADTAGRSRDLIDAFKREISLTKDPRRLVELHQKYAETLDERLEDNEAAISAYRTVLEIDANYAPALAGIGRLYNRLGRWNDLLATYTKELKLVEHKDDKVALLMKMAELADTHIGDEEAAVKFYRSAIAIDPTFAPAIHALTQTLIAREDFDTLTSILQTELDGLDAPLARARVAYRLGEIQEVNCGDLAKAAQSYKAAAAALPTYRPALDALHRVNAALSRYQELADQLYREAATDADQRFAIEALFQSGTVSYHHLNDATKAVDAFEKILSLSPLHAPALLSLIPLYRETGAFQKLSQAYGRLTDIVQDQGEKIALYKELARSLELAGEMADIEPVLRAVLSLDASDVGTLFGLEQIALDSTDWSLLADVDAYRVQMADDPALGAIHLARLALAGESTVPDEAVRAYQDAAAFDPNGIAAIKGLYALAVDANAADLQIEALEREAEWTLRRDHAADLLVRAAEIQLAAMRDLQAAVADLREALRRCPDHEAAAKQIIALLTETCQFDLLIDILNETADASSKNDRKAALLSQAAKLYVDAKGDLGSAVRALNKLLKSDPNHVPTMVRLAGLYKQNRQWEEAAKTLEKVIKRRPKQRVLTRVLLELAEIYLKHLDNPSNAINHIEELLKIDPDNVTALIMLCEVQFRRGKMDAANTAAEKLLGIAADPETKAQALLCAAQIRLKRGARKSAAKSFRDAIAIGGPSDSAWLKDYHALLGNEEPFEEYLAALKHYLEGLGGSPDNRERMVTCVTEISRVQHEGLGDVGGALATIEAASARLGPHPSLDHYRAKHLIGAGRFDDAAAQLTQLLKTAPANAEAWRLLAHVFRAKGLPTVGAFALAPLVVLGAATPEEQARAGQRVSQLSAGVAGSLSGQSMWDLSPRPKGEDGVTVLLAAIDDALAKVYPADLAAYGISAEDNLGSTSGHPLRGLAGQAASVFGISDFALYLNPMSNAVPCVELTQPLSILLPASLAGLSEPEQAFVISRVFAYAAKGQHALLKLGRSQLKLVLAALTYKHSPSLAGDYDAESLERMGKRITKATSWRSRRTVEDAAQQLAQSGDFDIDECLDGMAFASVRAAALLSGNLVAAVSALLKTEPGLGDHRGEALVEHVPMVRDLLSFWVSKRAFTLRKRAGLL